MREPAAQFHRVVTAVIPTILVISLTAAFWAAPLAAQTAEDMDALFTELAQTQGDGWARAQSDILRIWSRSGSASMDMLLQRGETALDNGDYAAAIGHLTALTDHAPDFAAGWAARSVAYAMSGQFGPAGSDMAQALRLEPRHWPTLTQLGAVLEEMGDKPRALSAFRASLAINPHQPEAEDAVTRLTRDEGQDI